MKEEATKSYEISFLVRGENGAASLVRYLNQFGGEILNEGEMKSIQLSYPIKKETSAYFGCIHCKLPKDSIEDMTKELELDENILRFLIVTPPFSRGKTERSVKGEPRPSVVKKESVTRTSKPQPETALSNEVLEEKLEEILK